MPNDPNRRPLAGLPVTSLGTLASRVLGMVRDMATAALLGLSGDGVMDAFVVAFRIPNLFRRLFGEGSLAASFLPVLTKELEHDPGAAWRLVSVTAVWLAATLALLVMAGEAACLLAWWLFGGDPDISLLVGLTAVMMPYLFFICLAAHISATLHACLHFGGPALVPTVLNVGWLGGAWVAAMWAAPDKISRAYVLAASIVLSGVVQLAFQLPLLSKIGFRFDYDWQATRQQVWTIVRNTGPMLVGLAVTQLNTFLDTLLAWMLAAGPGGPSTFSLAGMGVRYPLTQGAAAALYYGERLYQFPLGVLGVAVGTVLFPVLSRHVARGETHRLGDDISLGLRLVMYLGIPAGAGLMLIATPLARVLFERGEFTAADTLRVARMIVAYGVGVWAFCGLQVVVRGFYALGDQMTPLRIGGLTLALNLLLDVILMWPLAETGLALSTSLAAVAQLALLVAALGRHSLHLSWSALVRTMGGTLAATAIMLAAGASCRWLLPGGPDTLSLTASLAACIAVAAGAFFLSGQALGLTEWRLVAGGPAAAPDTSSPDNEGR